MAIERTVTTPVERPTESHDVLFQDELAILLRVSRATIERRRREGSFPIPELPGIDNRPRWSRRAVEQYLSSTKNGLTWRRRDVSRR
jgi:predicted DNA-binding transcriptional regulator AlpA